MRTGSSDGSLSHSHLEWSAITRFARMSLPSVNHLEGWYVGNPFSARPFIYHLFHVEYQVLEKEEEEENKRREFERRVQEAEYRGRVWQERAQAAEERERATQQELFELKRRFQAITTH